MKIALIYPPSADPTAPYISIPILTGYLRSKGVDVLPVDANIEAYDLLLRKESMSAIARRIELRLKQLKKKPFLNHTDQLAWVNLHQAKDTARAIPDAIGDAIAVMRDRSGNRFYDPIQYETALMTIENALSLVSAAYTPLVLDFSQYRTPFSLLDMDEIQSDAAPERDPFHEYFCGLAERLAQESPAVVGISIAFPGQIQPAYALAMTLRQKLPGAHITAGGPAITQILLRLTGKERDNALGPFHSAILFEGEEALLDLISSIEKGTPPEGIIRGEKHIDPGSIPAPDFEGLPLDKYLSPEPVLPYDPTRGCYWGKCAFCHYGLAETGTTLYRERPVKQVLDHMRNLSKKYHCRVFYFSQDTIHPKSAERLAQAFSEANAPWKWASDIRPEPLLTGDCCRTLANGGALSFSLGIESAAERVLGLIHKGIRLKDMRAAVNNLSNAGIAVECMTFTGFPSETGAEALATIRFIERLREKISLFICGEFNLVSGSRVAGHPENYGINNIWTVSGDEFIKTLFYTELNPSALPKDTEKVERALATLSQAFWLHNYPWAGSLSTAHTLLWYNRSGPTIFRDLSNTLPVNRVKKGLKNNTILKMGIQAHRDEAAIWHTLIHEKCTVSRQAYRLLADDCPAIFKKGMPY